VHNARIATFGERVEDTFLISDSAHQPLSMEARDTLAEKLLEHLEEG
jgi:[protein-PII] uridylyltransferase